MKKGGVDPVQGVGEGPSVPHLNSPTFVGLGGRAANNAFVSRPARRRVVVPVVSLHEPYEAVRSEHEGEERYENDG
jgi:hypothetical protein